MHTHTAPTPHTHIHTQKSTKSLRYHRKTSVFIFWWSDFELCTSYPNIFVKPQSFIVNIDKYTVMPNAIG